jgi:thioredoxin-dependent peroxiredoxin
MQSITKVPLFTLKDQDGNDFAIGDCIGKQKLVIFFYPKDDSLVCTKEACAFRDSFEVFKEAGARLIGISADPVESHKKFQQRHRLPYTLLSDPGNEVLKAFGVKNILFLTGRETFVVDLNGNIVFHFRSMLNGTAHMQKTLDFLRKG